MPERTTYEDERPKEECGIFGLYLHPSLASNKIIENSLECALKNQHRGEESVGVTISNGLSLWYPIDRRMGKISSYYEEYMGRKKFDGGSYGHIVAVHNRYSTTGSSNVENASPFRFETEIGPFSVSLNGNITNAHELKGELIRQGIKFASTTDSEVVGAVIAQEPANSWRDKVAGGVSKLKGAFCLIISTKTSLIAVRDNNGFHPLSLAQFEFDGRDCFALSSETVAFSQLRGKVKEITDVERGEIIEINESGISKSRFSLNDQEAFCGLEFTYLMRPESRFEGVQLAEIRRHFGQILARYHPAPERTDMVTFIPESAWPAAKGFADESNLPFEKTMTKDRYGTLNGTRRGFMSPNSSERKKVAKENYSVLDIVIDKNILVLDDSIIEATTVTDVTNTYRHFVGMYKDKGVKEIHLRIVFPQVISSCPFGIDIDDKRFLVAKEFGQNIEEIARFIGANSLEYLLIDEFQEGVDKAVGRKVGLCRGCTTGVYPQEVGQTNKLIFESQIK